MWITPDMKSYLALACGVLLALGGCTSTKIATRTKSHRASVSQTAAVAPPDCSAGSAEAAKQNAKSLYDTEWSPFGRPEKGWAIYAPEVGHEIGAACPADSAGFAAKLASWQAGHRLSATGVMDAATFDAMKTVWQDRRPFVALRNEGVCPNSPSEAVLAEATPAEGYEGKRVELRAAALNAYRRMVAAARAALPELTQKPELLTIFSAHRSPEYDAARCAHDGNCQGVVRAQCSAHRTGLAMDIDVGAAPGYSVDSSADPNRLFQAEGAVYRWLVANAPRFGFVNYAFEPWHWEWTGERP